MNDTEKLLRDFIEASGYEVTEIHNLEPDEFVIKQGFRAVPDDYKVTKSECNYANAINPVFTKEERAGFIDREIKTLTLRKERILNEKT